MLGLLWLVPAIPFASALALAVLRFPRRAVAWIAVGSIAASSVISLLVTFSFLHTPPSANAYTQVLWRWLDVGGFRPEIALYLDPLSLIMVVVVAFVSLLIHIYSTEFMIGNDGYARFFAYMNLFVASMLVLLLADNLLQLSAHRVLVSRSREWPGRTQSIHRDPRRRYRPDDRAVSSLP